MTFKQLIGKRLVLLSTSLPLSILSKLKIFIFVAIFFIFGSLFVNSVFAQAPGSNCNASLENQCYPGLICVSPDSSTNGVCVSPNDRDFFSFCGGLGQYCCYDTEVGNFPDEDWCFEGTKVIEGEGATVCRCFSSASGKQDLGGTCNVEADCLRGTCAPDNICKVESGCLDLSWTEFSTSRPAREFCENADGYYCSQDNPTSSYEWRWCCSDQATCQDQQTRYGGDDPTKHKGTAFEYCDQVPPSQRDDCRTCIADSTNEQGVQTRIYTAVGCIDVVGSDLAADLIRILIGVAGTAAFLSILGAAFLLTTSAGESSKVKQAKELLTAAVAGLLFMIFSVIILDFIGVSVLNIPGLTGGTRGTNSGGQISSPTESQYIDPYSVPEGGDCSNDVDCQASSGLLCLNGTCAQPNERFDPGSVTLGGQCYFDGDCQNQVEIAGETVQATVTCENRRCSINMVSAECTSAANPDRFCQDLLDDSRAMCLNWAGISNRCGIPHQDSERYTCGYGTELLMDPNYCNLVMNSAGDNYYCYFPDDGTDRGFCRER